MVGALLFVLDPASPADLENSGGDLTERKSSRAEFDVVAIFEIAQVKADDAFGMGADKCRHIGPAMVCVSGVEHEMHQRGVGLRSTPKKTRRATQAGAFSPLPSPA